MDVKEGELFFIDIRVQLELCSRIFSTGGRSVTGKGDVGTLVEFLRQLASQGIPGIGLGVYPQTTSDYVPYRDS